MKITVSSDYVICVPSNPCICEECSRHVANCDDYGTTLGMADLSPTCNFYEPMIPLTVFMQDAYVSPEQ